MSFTVVLMLNATGPHEEVRAKTNERLSRPGRIEGWDEPVAYDDLVNVRFDTRWHDYQLLQARYLGIDLNLGIYLHAATVYGLELQEAGLKVGLDLIGMVAAMAILFDGMEILLLYRNGKLVLNSNVRGWSPWKPAILATVPMPFEIKALPPADDIENKEPLIW